MNFETLHCHAGDHEWTRERKRGVKPDNCPEHKAEQMAEETAARVQAMQEGRERAQRERNREKVQAILDANAHVNCHCDINPEWTLEQLRMLGGGCTMPRWCCPVLDRVRRELED